MTLSTRWMEARRTCDEAYKQYLDIFGQHSLDYVDLWDPRILGEISEDGIAENLEGAEYLQKAIDQNKPYDNTPPTPEQLEMQKYMIY